MLISGQMSLKLYRQLAASGIPVDPRWNNLLAGWHLDESSPGTAGVTRADVLGTYTLTDTNTTTSRPKGPSGTVAEFTDNSEELSYTTVGSIPDLWPADNTSFSVSIWIRPDGTVTQNYLSATGGNGQGGFAIDLSSNVRFYLKNGSTTTGTVIAPGTTYQGSWHHFVFVYDNSAGKTYAYMDGYATPTEAAATGYTKVNFVGTKFRLGVDSANCPDAGMYAVAIYSGALNATQVATLYNNGEALSYADSPKTNLIEFYELSEASGSRSGSVGGWTLADAGTNPCGSSTATNFAIFNTAANFISANNEMLSDNTIVMPSSFTIALWSNSPLTATMRLVNQGNASNTGFSLFGINGGATYWQTYSGAGTKSVNTTVSQNVWTLHIAWYDAATTTMGFAINDGTPVTDATAPAPGAVTGAFSIGRVYTGGSAYTGQLDEVYYFNTSIGSDSSWRSGMYNSGAGRRYPN